MNKPLVITVLITFACVLVVFLLTRKKTDVNSDKQSRLRVLVNTPEEFIKEVTKIFSDIRRFLPTAFLGSETAFKFLIESDPKWQVLDSEIFCTSNKLNQEQKQACLNALTNFYIEFLQQNAVGMSSVVRKLYSDHRVVYDAIYECGMLDLLGELVFIIYWKRNKAKYPNFGNYILCSKKLKWNIDLFDLTNENIELYIDHLEDIFSTRPYYENSRLYKCIIYPDYTSDNT